MSDVGPNEGAGARGSPSGSSRAKRPGESPRCPWPLLVGLQMTITGFPGQTRVGNGARAHLPTPVASSERDGRSASWAHQMQAISDRDERPARIRGWFRWQSLVSSQLPPQPRRSRTTGPAWRSASSSVAPERGGRSPPTRPKSVVPLAGSGPDRPHQYRPFEHWVGGSHTLK